MKLDYATQVSPYPILLSMGTLRKPKLRDIFDPRSQFKMSFQKFNFYEFLISMSPEDFFAQLGEKEGKDFWASLPADVRGKITVFDLIIQNEELQKHFLEVFNFFFEETVLFAESTFVLVKPDKDYAQEPPTREDVTGFIDSHNFSEILSIMQQICCISGETEEETPKFKNKTAEKLYYQMKNAEKKQRQNRKIDRNMTLPNIISKVSRRHNSLNFTNIWDLTIFQLLDNFGGLCEDVIFDIECTGVSVWGDEKKKFDPSKWYKNNFDNRKSDF